MRKNVFLPNGNNKSTFQPEGAAPAASSLKSSYIKNEEKLSKERGTLKSSYHFTKLLILIFSRNLAFNFFPYMLRERKQLQQSLETEVRIVYQYARMIDVCDEKNNCKHISIDDIFYCKKNGNETKVYTVEGIKYTRYCTIKYLMQLLDNKDFVRTSSSIIIPFQYIASCDGKAVVMKTMPWMETPLTFKLDSKRYPQIQAAINEYQLANIGGMDSIQIDCEEEKDKKNQSVPPKEKLDAVFNYVKEHPGCRSTEIISHTSYPKTTMERCLSYLKRQGLVDYSGSKKKGGYHLVNEAPEVIEVDPSRQEEKATGDVPAGRGAREKCSSSPPPPVSKRWLPKGKGINHKLLVLRFDKQYNNLLLIYLVTPRLSVNMNKEKFENYGVSPEVVYPHSFRHRFAKNFLEKYKDIALLADLMGHESIETTRIYLRMTAGEQYSIVNKVVTW